MKRRHVFHLIGMAALVLAGCFSPNYANGHVQCAPTGQQCPSGYHCASNNTCWQNGQDPSPMGMDMGNPPVVAVPPAAVWISSGGGSPTAMSGAQCNVSIGGVDVGGTKTAASTASFTPGFFGTDSY